MIVNIYIDGSCIHNGSPNAIAGYGVYFKNNDIKSNNNDKIIKCLMESGFEMSLGKKWLGCFGVQSFINHAFLSKLQQKYNLFRLLECVRNRPDRCCLERIMGVLFFLEEPNLTGSLFGDILKYSPKITYQQHRTHMQKYKSSHLPYIKVWSGR